MKSKYLWLLLSVILLQTLLTIFVLLEMQFDAGRGRIFHYPALRTVLVAVLGLSGLAALGLGVVLGSAPVRAARLLGRLDDWLTGGRPRLFFVQGALFLLGIFLFESFLLTYIAFPVPARPFLLWASLGAFELWLTFRLVYAKTYRQHPSWLARLRTGWRAWLPAQRRTFIVLTVIGMAVFCAFAPFNYRLDAQGRFLMHPDEHIIYPDVAKTLVIEGTFADMVRKDLETWPFWYGFPYLPLSAGVLLVPRLIFGNDYVNQVQLNIFLLRQFISVLPMILAIGLLVYLVTRFRSLAASVGLYVFLLLIPGVVKYNYRFWHPDGLILLLVVLTLFFLDRDRLRFGRNFYLAAAACGLAAAIKLWGLFFFLTIAGTLLAGLIRKVLTFRRMLAAGAGFIGVMLLTIILSSPTLLAPQPFLSYARGIQYESQVIAEGYDEPDPTGVYQTGLANWLPYFQRHYMEPYFFFFAFFALLAGSLVGSARPLNRLFLSWCLVLAVYLIGFVAVKRYHYMLPLMVPLSAAPILFPGLAEGWRPRWLSFLGKPAASVLLWLVTIGMYASQFVFNLVTIFTSSAMGF
ncbi:MAG: hypothetical protein ABWK53_09810 [Anaerolineales bacterium]